MKKVMKKATAKMKVNRPHCQQKGQHGPKSNIDSTMAERPEINTMISQRKRRK